VRVKRNYLFRHFDNLENIDIFSLSFILKIGLSIFSVLIAGFIQIFLRSKIFLFFREIKESYLKFFSLLVITFLISNLVVTGFFSEFDILFFLVKLLLCFVFLLVLKGKFKESVIGEGIGSIYKQL